MLKKLAESFEQVRLLQPAKGEPHSEQTTGSAERPGVCVVEWALVTFAGTKAGEKQ